MAHLFVESEFTTTTTAQAALGRNNNRAYLAIQNNGEHPIRIGFSDALTDSTGLLLNAGIAYCPYPCPLNAVYVIRDATATADVPLSIVETET